MLAFTLRRFLQAIGVMLAVGVIAFAMFRFAGDPVNQIVSIDTSAAQRAEIRHSLGLDDPVLVQFGHYFINALQFKFGVSYQFRLPVSSLLAERLPATLELSICATLFAMVAGILMGVYSALRRDTVLAKLFQAVSLIGISLPTFLIGILLIYLFAVTLGWLPSFGRGEVVKLGWWTTGLLTVSGLKALIMPSLGTLIRIGNNYLFAGEWWIVAFPGIALAGLILSINLLGDWLRDALNPKLR